MSTGARPSWTHEGLRFLSLDHGSVVESVTIESNGQPRSEVATIAQVTGQIVWAEAVASASGPVVLWAEQRRDKATITSARLDTQGKLVGQPTSIASSVRAWQVTATASGTALALVRAGEGADAGATVGGARRANRFRSANLLRRGSTLTS
jgi:hypothetical protein